MTFVLIVAGIDLSVGSVMALSGAVFGLAIADMHTSIWLAAILCLMTGFLCGICNGLIVTRWGVPSFIVPRSWSNRLPTASPGLAFVETSPGR